VLDIVLAFAAGLLTLINPCVLPLLPLIAAGAIARDRRAPLAMAIGLALGFTLAGMGVYALTRATGIFQEDIARAAGWLMVGLGGLMLIAPAQERFARMTAAVAGGGTMLSTRMEGRGLLGETAAGALLGLAWSPCIGPTLGAAIGLAAAGESLGQALLVMVFFSLGAASVMLALSYGARGLIAGRRARLQALAPFAKPVLAGALIVIGLGLAFGLDRQIEGWMLDRLPAWLTDFSVMI
jgi:cytochrome c-type biogenesis protein